MPDGRIVEVWRMAFTWRLTVTEPENDGMYWTDGWCYDNPLLVVLAFDAWSGEGEPEGWSRHPDSGRRRPGGDKSQEYVNP